MENRLRYAFRNKQLVDWFRVKWTIEKAKEFLGSLELHCTMRGRDCHFSWTLRGIKCASGKVHNKSKALCYVTLYARGQHRKTKFEGDLARQLSSCGRLSG
jgi:hypothetical protein